jgi:hypothetical protein
MAKKKKEQELTEEQQEILNDVFEASENLSLAVEFAREADVPEELIKEALE